MSYENSELAKSEGPCEGTENCGVPDHLASIGILSKQRDFLGDQLRRALERNMGLRLAAGQIRANDVMPLLIAEMEPIDAALKRIAEGPNGDAASNRISASEVPGG